MSSDREQSQTTVDDPAWVEHRTHPCETVTIIERFVPAKEGEYAPFLFRPAGRTKYIAMKLESRRVVDGRL